MRFVDEYRAPEQVMQLIEHLRERASHLSYTAERPLRIMEVCGGHTHAIFKFGLDQLLPENVEFIHGPGCPVCVLPMGRIDTCVEIASHPEVIFCTFGDAMRVPGKQGSLLQAKARGADVRIVYSPMDALKLAQENPTRKVVFFGLGFETTMPTTAITLQQAKARDVQNFYFFCQHITLIPTLRSLLEQPITVSTRSSRRATLVWLSALMPIILSPAIFIVRWWSLVSNPLIYCKAWSCWWSRK